MKKISRNKVRWNRKSMMHFFDRLSMYIDAGISIDESVRECARIEKSAGLRVSAENIAQLVSEGVALSYAIEKQMKAPDFAIGMIRAGEKSGRLSEACSSIKDTLMRSEELKKKILSSVTYPLAVGIFSIILIVGLMRWVLPEIIPTLQSFHKELPLITRCIMYISRIITEHGIVLLLLIISIGILFHISYIRIKLFRSFVHSVLMRTPIVGQIILLASLSLWSRSIGAMISANVPIRDSFSLSLASIKVLPLRKNLSLMLDSVAQGKKISDLVGATKFRVPQFVVGLIHAGETSGNLGQSFTRIAHILDAEIEHSLKRTTSLIEPALMIVMGSAIGIIALSIILPIYDVSKILQK